MTAQLQDKVAIVTGGGGGIGKRIAREFAKAGADVVVASRSLAKLEPIAQEVRDIGRKSLAIATDVTDAQQVEAMVNQTVAEFGRVDIMVNNAGGAMFIKPPEKLLPDEWSAAIALNLTSVFLCSVAAGKVMMANDGGRIINIASIWGREYGGSADYMSL